MRIQPRRTLRLPGYGIDCRDMDGGKPVGAFNYSNGYTYMHTTQKPRKSKIPKK